MILSEGLTVSSKVFYLKECKKAVFVHWSPFGPRLDLTSAISARVPSNSVSKEFSPHVTDAQGTAASIGLNPLNPLPSFELR